MPRRRPSPISSDAPRPERRQRAKPPNFPGLESFAGRLEQLRRERGLSQRALAERARISKNHYIDIAHANANPTVIVLLKLVAALGASLTDLLESQTPPDTWHSVLVADLRDLAATHQRLTAVVRRLAKSATRGDRPAKRCQSS